MRRAKSFREWFKPGASGRPDTAALERERRRGFVVVRLRLDGGAKPTQIVAA